uniref:Alpha kinase 1 n=1 Tax=Salmo trutta TaxID=8032 RepID=A0A674EAS9_SALTR
LLHNASLSVELSMLLQEAVAMRWPFVPEKWQYKQSVTSQDKVNLKDFISLHLPQLLALLKASILAREPQWAASVVFLMDRFLYWTDESSRLLKITKLLHRHYPGTPIAPQLVIRQARVYLNDGKLQKAEYILSSLINTSGATGCWVYQSDSDRTLIQAVSVQVRGQVLQKLGLWLEAAELIWTSLVGYYALPQPDKKGIGTSLGILANILVSMNDGDFHAFKTNPGIDLCFLENDGHRLLSAAEAAKMAVVYSQYASLYVLTNVVTQGTCLLSYSFSVECPPSDKHSFLFRAKEAFEIGLLTKTGGDMVTSKQELHTFLKAAYSLTVSHKWLGTPQKTVDQARLVCREALEKFYAYCHADSQQRDALCTGVMSLISQVKIILRVNPFLNSDKGSFIPDSYRDVVEERAVRFTLDGFSKVMGRFRQYHTSVCEASEASCRRKHEGHQAGLCITALGTTATAPNTECATENHKPQKATHKEELHRDKVPNASCLAPRLPQEQELCTTLGSTEELPSNSYNKMSLKSLSSSFGSSFEKVSLNSPGSPLSCSGYKDGSVPDKVNMEYLCDPNCLTEVSEDGLENGPESKSKTRKRDIRASLSAQAGSNSSTRVTSSSSTHTGSDVEQFEMIDEQSLIETVETEEECHGCGASVSVRPTGDGVVMHPGYQDKASGLWTSRETYVYIGEPIGKQGQQRIALWVQFLHQEERLSSYVGKEYLEPKGIQFHLSDVERQMTAQYYVTEFNKRLYKEKVTAQIFFIPSEVLLILEGDEVVDCVTVEPYMLGDFVKLTNNTTKVDKRFKASEYGIAFGHFTYQFSGCQEVVVDLQGWVTANGKGLTYLTDPQIHSLRTPKGATNFAERGVNYFLKDQHGPECNSICDLLSLGKLQ